MTREEQLKHVRTIQRAVTEAPSDGAPSLRIVLEFDARPDPVAVTVAVRERLGIDIRAAPLSGDHGLETGAGSYDGLARFLAVTIVGLPRNALPGSLFEISYAIGDAAGAVTAEPETGAPFYRVPPPATDGALEGIDSFPPGCWVDASQDPTPDLPFWALDAIGARKAWDLPPPAGGRSRGEGISIFQPDTGVADHIEIEAGMLDLARARDFVANGPGATDPLNYSGNPGHGTGTASVVASRSTGTIAGSAPLARLVPLRAVESVVVFDHGRVAAAVEHARRSGAEVITMSLGGPWSSALRAAIGAAIRDGVIVLAAAGNCVKLVVWPARYEEVIAVAGSNLADKPWKGSSRGGAVDISAPGEFVPRANRSAENGGSSTSVAGGQGTSFAVALTAGVAALWLAHHGANRIKQSLGPAETVQKRFIRLLRETARRPAGFDTARYGAGIVDAEKLLGRGLGVPIEEALESVAETSDALLSLRTALMEAPIPVAAGLEAVAPAPSQPSAEDRRFAAELSHLALQQSLRAQGGGDVLESISGDLAPSPTLVAAWPGLNGAEGSPSRGGNPGGGMHR